MVRTISVLNILFCNLFRNLISDSLIIKENMNYLFYNLFYESIVPNMYYIYILKTKNENKCLEIVPNKP